MPATALSQSMRQLVDLQRRRDETLRTQYDQDRAKRQQHYQKQALFQKQQHTAQQQSQRQTQTQHRQIVEQWAKFTSNSQTMVAALKAHGADWHKLTQREQKLLERGAHLGLSSGQIYQLLGKQHRHDRQRLEQRQELDVLSLHRRRSASLRQLSAGRRRQRLTAAETNAAEREQQRDEKRRQQDHRRELAALPGRTLAAVRAVTAIGQALQNPFATTEGQLKQVGDALSQFGGKIGLAGEAMSAFIGLKRVIDGTGLALMHLHLALPHIQLAAARTYEVQAATDTGEFLEAQQRFRAEALRAKVQPGGAIGRIGAGLVAAAGRRSTFKGQLEYEVQAAAYQPRIDVERARAEVEAARRAKVVADRQEVQARTVREAGERRVAASRQNVNRALTDNVSTFHFFGHPLSYGTSSRPVIEALDSQKRAVADATARIKVEQDAVNRAKEASVALSQKELGLAQAQVRAVQAEKEARLSQAERIQSHGARAIGSMHVAQQAMTRQAIKMYQSGMPLNVMPAAYRSLLDQIAPEAMRNRYEQTGKKTRAYQEAVAAGLIPEGDLNKTRQQLAEVKANVTISLGINEAKFVEKLADAIDTRFRKLIDLIEAKIRAGHQDIDTNQRVRHAGD